MNDLKFCKLTSNKYDRYTTLGYFRSRVVGVYYAPVHASVTVNGMEAVMSRYRIACADKTVVELANVDYSVKRRPCMLVNDTLLPIMHTTVHEEKELLDDGAVLHSWDILSPFSGEVVLHITIKTRPYERS